MGAGCYRKTDFYVGTNGGALEGRYKDWIGVSKRASLMSKVKNPVLKNAINQLYREGSFIGDGGTASVLKFEKRNNKYIGRNGNSHLQKSIDMSKYLRSKVLTQNLTNKERKIATSIYKRLVKAIIEFNGGLQ